MKNLFPVKKLIVAISICLPICSQAQVAQKAKKNRGLRKAANGSTTTQGSTTHASGQMSPKETTPLAIQMNEVSAMEEGKAGEIATATLYDGHR